MHHSGLIPKPIDEYCQRYTENESPLLNHLIQETYSNMELPHMLVGRIGSQLLKLLVTLSQAKVIFEIGAFTGYSSLAMAEALPTDGHITTCEVDKRAQTIAEKYFKLSPYGYKIDLVMGPGLKTLENFDKTIDLAFVDADKINYPNYLALLTKKVKVGGLMIFDNMLLNGRALSPSRPSCRAVNETNQQICSDTRLENIFLPVQDGIQIVRKISE